MDDPLSILIGLLRTLREAETAEALRFAIVNATHRLLPYDSAVLLQPDDRARWRIIAVSGGTAHDDATATLSWLERTAGSPGFASRVRVLHDMATEPHDSVAANLSGYPLWVPLTETGGRLLGALWLRRAEPWHDGEIALLGELADAQAHALDSLDQRNGRRNRRGLRKAFYCGWPIMAVIAVALLFIPVQRAALAPVEIVARDPAVVAAPIEGVIRSFEVEPNQRVEAGDILFTLDDTDRRAKVDVAAKALDVARVEYRQASQGALGGRRDAAKLAALEAQIALKEIELDNARQQMARTQARAGRAGVALLPDVQDFVGRPVVTGERVMLVADPNETEARAWLAVHDALPVADGASVRIFLDADPLKPLNGRVARIHHEAEETPTGIAYRVMVRLDPASTGGSARIGARGTARIDGDRAPLFLYLFRRPIAALRQALGV